MKGAILPEENHISVVVWRANGKGYSRWFGKITVAFDYTRLWMNEKEIPLTSIKSVEELGPGFRVTWADSNRGRLKQAAFCCPTVKGYSRGRRNQIVNALRHHIEWVGRK